jgi:uncharacterized protein YciI
MPGPAVTATVAGHWVLLRLASCPACLGRRGATGTELRLTHDRRHRPGVQIAEVVPGRGGPSVGSGQYAPVMANFAVRLVHGPGWNPSRQTRDQDAWDEHAAFMDGLVDDGFIILGGPVGDGEQTLHVVEAADDNEIKARLAGDPWASAGLLQIGAIEPWALWLDSRPKNSAR